MMAATLNLSSHLGLSVHVGECNVTMINRGQCCLKIYTGLTMLELYPFYTLNNLPISPDMDVNNPEISAPKT